MKFSTQAFTFVRCISAALASIVPIAGLAQQPDARPVAPNPTRASAVEKRAAWTTSRITGSPEPPALYRTERMFPNLKFVEPLELVALPGGNRFVLAEHAGKIYSFPNDPDCESPDLFADMKRWNREIQEVYSVTFHPQFEKNRYAYLWYILKAELPDGTRISRFKVTETNPPQVDLSTEHVVITWKSGGHNGGCARFGRDGMLYISTGDGVGPDPPDSSNTGQDISDLLSSILRIDVDHESDGKGYSIPPDNPFVNTPGARPEVWAYGLRNPWRMSVDLKTGDLWTADVGWELWEMVYRVERGGNYGWSIMEGSRQQIKPQGKHGPTPILPPTFEHPHSEAASITGGSVYRGKRLRDLVGAYIYGDFETGKIWALRHDGARVTSQQELVDTAFKVVSFGEDHEGELYIVDFNGTLQRLVPNPAAQQLSAFPRKISETGLFISMEGLRPQPGVVPYSINAEQWLDGAVAQRLVALPGESIIATSHSPWAYPTDAVLVRTLSLPREAAQTSLLRKVETQLLHYNGESWNAYSYRWNDEQTDADLVEANGAEQTFTIKDATAPNGQRQQTWRFASRAECLRCHNSWCGFVLGFNTPELDRLHVSAGSGSEMLRPQLQTLAACGILDKAPEGGKGRKLANPHGAEANLNDRARSWLHVNCSHCHREHAGGSVLSFMNFDGRLERLNLVGARPMQGTFGMDGAEVVAAGDPYRSTLYYRISKLGRGHMPYLGSRIIDERGTALMHDWIQNLPRKQTNDPTEIERLAKIRSTQFADAAQLKFALPATERDRIIDKLLESVSSALVLLQAVTEGSLGAETRNAVV
ncbi:MAG: PQQ-dependent sugar dehydrogenase, partial [Verrucomicrobiales bacterium]|nr:PQQ-dependent sugar dehydrogenase [Verrucomicrobiales bacterium]